MKDTFEINRKPGAAKSRWLGFVGLALIAASTWIAFGGLPLGGSLRDRSGSLRAGWYLHSGQWRADIRTLVAALSYVMDRDMSVQPQGFSAATAQCNEAANAATIYVLRFRPGDPQLDLQANVINFTQSVEFYHQGERGSGVPRGI